MGRSRKEIDTSTYTGRFAVRLRELRVKKKMSVEELAEKSGIPVRSIYNWESATSQPLLGQLPLLAESLSVKVRTLIPEK